MNKKIILGILLALMLTLSLMTTGAFAQEEEPPDLVRFTIQNQTGERLAMYLNAEGLFYYFNLDPDTTRIFTVPREAYTHTTYTCGQYIEGTVDLNRQLELIFPSCSMEPVNLGEPSIEKVYLGVDIPNSKWQFQID